MLSRREAPLIHVDDSDGPDHLEALLGSVLSVPSSTDLSRTIPPPLLSLLSLLCLYRGALGTAGLFLFFVFSFFFHFFTFFFFRHQLCS